MEVDLAPSEGLRQVITALAVQLDATRQQLSHLQRVKEKKEGLLHIGNQVLRQHCDASWGPGKLGGLQASVASCTATTLGWEIAVIVQGLPETTPHLPKITVSVTHPSAIFSVRQLQCRPWSRNTNGDKAGIQTKALIQLHGAPPALKTQETDSKTQVHAIIVSEEGAPCAAVPAGHITLDHCGWIRALAHQMEPVRPTSWPCASHFGIKLPQNSDVLEIWLDELLIDQLGCERGVYGEEMAAGTAWTLGSAAEVTLSPSATLTAISVFAQNEVLMSTLRSQIESHFRGSTGVSSTSVVLVPLSTNSTTRSGEQPSKGSLVEALDALISELHALQAWVVVLKQQCSEEEGAVDVVNAQQIQSNAADLQAAAIKAMMHTDRTAAVALAPYI